MVYSVILLSTFSSRPKTVLEELAHFWFGDECHAPLVCAFLRVVVENGVVKLNKDRKVLCQAVEGISCRVLVWELLYKNGNLKGVSIKYTKALLHLELQTL